MRRSAFIPLMAALAMAAIPRPVAAATLSAFAGITITFETQDDANPVWLYTRVPNVINDDTDGDGTTGGGATQIAASLTNAPVFTTSNRVNADAAATVTGEASYSFELVQRFSVLRSADADREVTITLAPLLGFGGTLL